MADLRINDEAKAFFITNSYPKGYNDGMMAWLKAYYFTEAGALRDLMARYIAENGYTMLTAFTPADLFAAAEPGAWYDMTDLSTLWQDTAGTTPVTTAGQSCARIDDKSGNGHHATQATGTKQPIVRQNASGVFYLEFDGVDDELVNGSANMSGSQKSLFGLGGKVHATASAQGYPFDFGGNYQIAGNAGFLLATPSLGGVLVGGRSTTGAATAISSGASYGRNVPFVQVGVFDFAQAAGSELYAISQGNRIEQDQGLAEENTGTLSAAGTLAIGSRNGAVFFKGDVYCCVMRGGASTQTEATRLSHYINESLGAY